MEELLNKLKELGVIRAIGDYADYEPDGKHKDTIYFAEDEEKIYLNDKNYGGSDISGLLEDYAKVSDLNNYVQKEDGKVLSSNDYTNEDKAKVDSIDNKVNKVDGKQLSTNDYTDTDKAKVENTYTKTQVDTKFENFGTLLTSTWDAQLEDSYNSLNNNKVDKVEGKQLSTEDFTTALKQKLESLTNYNDEELSGKIDELKEALDIILNSEDTTSVIDTWEEVKNFLASVTNEETLAGMLLDLRNDIVSLCADTYVSKTKDEEIGGSKTFEEVGIFKSKNITDGRYTKIGGGLVEQVLPTRGYAGGFSWNEQDGTVLASLGVFSSIVSPTDETRVLNYYYFGTDYKNPIVKIDPNGNITANSFIKKNGTSSQFLKADGSVDGTSYLASSSYNASDVLAKIKTVDGAGSGLDADLLDGVHVSGLFRVANYKDDANNLTVSGAYMTLSSITNTPSNVQGNQILHFDWDVNAANQLYLRYNADAMYFRRKASGTWQNWKQFAFTDSNVASADKLTTKQLTNEDLNEIKDVKFSSYNAGVNHNCINTPISNYSNVFYLYVFGITTNYICQIFITADGIIFKRYFNNTWSAWVRMATTNDVAPKLTTKQLTNEDLNNIKDTEFSCYYAKHTNSVTNKPSGVDGFGLQVIRISLEEYAQILTIGNGTYKRTFNKTSGSWKPWKKMFTEDDIQIVTRTEYSNLTTKNTNTLYFIKQ